MTADKILQKHEDANEMHFHEVDRQWIIQAMEEYATSSQTEISDEEIVEQANNFVHDDHVLFVTSTLNQKRFAFSEGAKWYREQLKQRQ